MTIRALGRAATLVAAGFLVWCATPAQAACNANDTSTCESDAAQTSPAATQLAQAENPGKPINLKKFTKRSEKTKRPRASQSRAARKSAVPQDRQNKSEAAADDTVLKEPSPGATARAETSSPFDGKPHDVAAPAGVIPLPSGIANANAQLYGADAPAHSVPVSDPQSPVAHAPESDAPAPAAEPDSSIVAADQLNDLDKAATAAPAAPVAAMAVVDSSAQMASSNDATWEKTSTIGKIFIAVGALLTLASAARMFIA